MLTRLEIYPIEIGMNLQAVFEDGNIFKPDVLDINIDEFISQIKEASYSAFNLAIQSAWTTNQTIETLILKAYQNAFLLAIEQGIITKNTIKSLISKANAQMLALKNITT
jgi:large subunit ribosomal protein L10